MLKVTVLCLLSVIVTGLPQTFQKQKFKVGIEYDHSLPMSGGSDRYRHRNHYDPFFVTVTATAKSGYVISYIEVTATVDEMGEVDFSLVRGKTGSRTMVFQLVSNNSEFLSYTYLAYGIREDEYKKISNIITLPNRSNSSRQQHNYFTSIVTILSLGYITL